jgi:hypothetical protein
MGDVNGRTGRNTVVGNFGEDMAKDNGERLIELCTQTALEMCINIHGSHRQKT